MPYILDLVKLLIVSEPEVGFEPDQPLEAVQAVTLAEVQERVALALKAMVIGPSEPLALMFRVGRS